MPVDIYRNTKSRSSDTTTKNYLTTGITTNGNTVIGSILDQNVIMLPLEIETLGRFGSILILQHSLLDIRPSSPLTFTPAKPNVTSMYSPSPKGVINLVDHN